MLKSENPEYHRMECVVHEIENSFGGGWYNRDEIKQWKFKLEVPRSSDGTLSDQHYLTVSKEGLDEKFLISSKPLYYKINMDEFFDVLVDYGPSLGLSRVQIFSAGQKERLYRSINECCPFSKIISEIAEDMKLETFPFKNSHQMSVFNHFITDDTKIKFANERNR